MKPHPCLNRAREAAEKAERRKVEAIDRLNAKLGPGGPFEQAMHDLINADKRATQEKGR